MGSIRTSRPFNLLATRKRVKARVDGDVVNYELFLLEEIL
jgi:hypothetical protein